MCGACEIFLAEDVVQAVCGIPAYVHVCACVHVCMCVCGVYLCLSRRIDANVNVCTEEGKAIVPTKSISMQFQQSLPDSCHACAACTPLANQAMRI